MNALRAAPIMIALLAGCGDAPPNYADARIPLEAEAVWVNRLPMASSNSSRTAELRAVRGAVAVSSDKGASWREGKAGESIPIGSILRTGKNVFADITLTESGPAIRLGSNARAELARLDIEDTGIEKMVDAMIDLQEGALQSSAPKLSAAPSIIVKTRGGVVTRGPWSMIRSDGTVLVESEKP